MLYGYDVVIGTTTSSVSRAPRSRNIVCAWFQLACAASASRVARDLAGRDEPPQRWVAGADAVESVEQKVRVLLAQVDANRGLSSSLAFGGPDRA